MFVAGIFMPYKIRITDLRVEAMQSIGYEDCVKEGVVKCYCGYYVKGLVVRYRSEEFFMEDGYPNKLFPTAQKAFTALIDKISGNGTWGLNPYNFAYSFELVKQ